MLLFRSSRLEVFCKKGVLGNFVKFTGKHLYQSLFFNKEALAQVFSSEFCEISKNTVFYRTPLVAASNNFPYYFSKVLRAFIFWKADFVNDSDFDW